MRRKVIESLLAERNELITNLNVAASKRIEAKDAKQNEHLAFLMEVSEGLTVGFTTLCSRTGKLVRGIPSNPAIICRSSHDFKRLSKLKKRNFMNLNIRYVKWREK